MQNGRATFGWRMAELKSATHNDVHSNYNLLRVCGVPVRACDNDKRVRGCSVDLVGCFQRQNR